MATNFRDRREPPLVRMKNLITEFPFLMPRYQRWGALLKARREFRRKISRCDFTKIYEILFAEPSAASSGRKLWIASGSSRKSLDVSELGSGRLPRGFEARLRLFAEQQNVQYFWVEDLEKSDLFVRLFKPPLGVGYAALQREIRNWLDNRPQTGERYRSLVAEILPIRNACVPSEFPGIWKINALLPEGSRSCWTLLHRSPPDDRVYCWEEVDEKMLYHHYRMRSREESDSEW